MNPHQGLPAPAELIVTYGGANPKTWPIHGDLVVIGRAPTCDLGLVSGEVAPVHCILFRRPEGWRGRRGGGRGTTRLNGEGLTEAPLHDGDVVQIGAFVVEARLPPVPVPAPTAAAAARTPVATPAPVAVAIPAPVAVPAAVPAPV